MFGCCLLLVMVLLCMSSFDFACCVILELGFICVWKFECLMITWWFGFGLFCLFAVKCLCVDCLIVDRDLYGGYSYVACQFLFCFLRWVCEFYWLLVAFTCLWISLVFL